MAVAAGASSSQRSRSGVATVERALDVLNYFVESGEPDLGVTEIAAALGLSKPVVHRLLNSLRAGDLIHADERTRRYSLGVGAMRLGQAYLRQIDLSAMAKPVLAELSNVTQETATLSLRQGRYRFYIDQVTPKRDVIMSVDIGEPFPLHAGASSKVFLAHQPQEFIDAYVADPIMALTANTTTDAQALLDELEVIRHRGWTASDGQRKAGASSVAAPVFNHRNEVAAVISVCGPTDRFVGERDVCREHLLTATRELSRRMGWVEPTS